MSAGHFFSLPSVSRCFWLFTGLSARSSVERISIGQKENRLAENLKRLLSVGASDNSDH